MMELTFNNLGASVPKTLAKTVPLAYSLTIWQNSRLEEVALETPIVRSMVEMIMSEGCKGIFSPPEESLFPSLTAIASGTRECLSLTL
jgi:hypothetical protein